MKHTSGVVSTKKKYLSFSLKARLVYIQLFVEIFKNKNLSEEIIEMLLKNGLNSNFFDKSPIFNFNTFTTEERDISLFEYACLNVISDSVIFKMLEYGTDLNLLKTNEHVFQSMVSISNFDRKMDFSRFLLLLSTNLVSDTVLEKSIQVCENKKIFSLLLQYQNEFIWSKENHKYFSQFFQNQITCLYLCFREKIVKNFFQLTFPKPIILIITKFISRFPLKQTPLFFFGN